MAAVHAGWRGVVANVVANAIAKLGEPRRLLAAIGPCIGMEAFEVGPEVLAAFEKAFGPDAQLERRAGGKGRVDLRQAVRSQLIRASLSTDRIDVSDRCTHRDAGEFYSHRRDRGVTGRMAAIIAPRP